VRRCYAAIAITVAHCCQSTKSSNGLRILEKANLLMHNVYYSSEILPLVTGQRLTLSLTGYHAMKKGTEVDRHAFLTSVLESPK
jgi:hypothetical protein